MRQDGRPTSLLDLPDESLIAIFAALASTSVCRLVLPLVCARLRDLLRQPSAVWQVGAAFLACASCSFCSLPPVSACPFQRTCMRCSMTCAQRACTPKLLSGACAALPAQGVVINFSLPEGRMNLRVLHTAMERWLRPRTPATTTLCLRCAGAPAPDGDMAGRHF
jgi:hypothetical protein